QAKTYQYNLFGNMISDGVNTFTYDGGHGLIGVTTPNGSVNYGLNALHQRVVKSGPLVPSGATAYLYDEQGHLLGEYDVNGNALQETIYLGDMPIAVVR
ncbi:MAG: type IV secretion protein Rhs, partial [Gammaproteobacteria bacterium]|nr:type IV secretion protein Rhs [Gammaproteobacteria bacterium]